MATRNGPARRLILVGWACLLTAAPAAARLEIDIPESGMHFVDLAGAFAGVEWRIDRLTVRGKVVRSELDVSGSLTFDAEGVALRDESGTRVAQGLRVEGTLEIAELSDETLRGRVELVLAAGEVLWNLFYLDIALYPLALSGEFDLPLGSGATAAEAWLEISDAAVAVAGIGELRGSGRVQLDSFAAELHAVGRVHGLERLYLLLVRELLGESWPNLSATQVFGSLHLDFDYRREAFGDYVVVGDLRLRDGVVIGPAPGLQVRGLRADLPINLGSGALPPSSRRGSLGWSGATLQGIEMHSLRLPIVVGPNAIALERSSSVEILGGSLTLREIEGTHLVDSARRFTMALAVDGIDLEQLSKGLGLPQMVGTLSGSMPRIEIGDGELRSTGEIVADVFGGRVRARNLHGEGLRSTVPAFGFDLDFDELRLADLTRVLSFGYISGVARGAVRGLEFVSWGPVAFDAWLESVPTDGVAQTLSVDAIRQLSIVGGGGSDPISAGIMSFFDEYGYSKLGFRCRLRNDVFELEGVEKRDGREHLVVPSLLPPRIAVISHVRTISFSDMVSRLEPAVQ